MDSSVANLFEGIKTARDYHEKELRQFNKLLLYLPKRGEWVEVGTLHLEVGKKYIVRRNWGAKDGDVSKSGQDIDFPGVSEWTESGWKYIFGKDLNPTFSSLAKVEVFVLKKR